MNSLNSECQGIKTQYSLVKHLKLYSESDEKYKNLYATWVQDEKVYTNALATISTSFPHYSMHDASHSWSIVNKIEMILGESRIRQLSPTDTFLILETAFVHDLGMIISEEDQKELWSKIEFRKYIEDIINNNYDKDLVAAASYIKDIEKNGVKNSKDWPIEVKKYVVILNADYFRRIHNSRSAEIIVHSSKIEVLRNRNNLIQERIMRLIAQISIMHGTNFSDIVEKLYKKENGVSTDEIHPRMIACLLRLGDLLDLDNGRFGEVLSNTVYMPESSKEHKEKHQAITHFLVSPERIEVAAICPNDSVYRATRQWFDWLQDELKNLSSKWSDIVPTNFIGGPPSLGEIKLSIKDSSGITEQLNFKFNIDQKVAFEFIEGSGIYENRLDCIREIIQNSLDATKMQIWNDVKIGRYSSLKECDDILKKLEFSSTVPKFIKNMYQLKIQVDYVEADNDDESEFKISIEDSGCGISQQDLKRMESVGQSWKDDIEKYKIIEDMPDWMKPTGSFGVGLHSIFMITDTVEIDTKAENSDAFYITFVSSKNNGYISTKINPNRKKNGTKISFSFKSKFIKDLKFDIFSDMTQYNSNIWDDFELLDRELDLVDTKYSSKKNKSRMCILLNNYIKNIDWLSVEKQGILVEDDLFNGDSIEHSDENDNLRIFDDYDDLEITIGFNKSRLLETHVRDKEKLSEMNFKFLDLSEYNKEHKSFSLGEQLNIKPYGDIFSKSKVYYKNIFCSPITTSIFNVKLNIVEGQAKQLLSINRNRFMDSDILKSYLDRIENYLRIKVLIKMHDYICSLDDKYIFNYQDYMDVILLTLQYEKYYGKVNREILDKNVIYNEWEITDSIMINSDGSTKKVTLKEILSSDKIMIVRKCDEESKNIAKENKISILLEEYWYRTEEVINLLGFNQIECIVAHEIYIASHDEINKEEDYIPILDYNNKKLVKTTLKSLYNYESESITPIRLSIRAFKYKNKINSKIKYLIIDNNRILSPFTKQIEKDIFTWKIDEIIEELKESYKFNELIEYVYNLMGNTAHKNTDYKKEIENAYKELISDYIEFVVKKDEIQEKEVAIDIKDI
ncbi:ATP-binding protein [Clostridium sp. YIM B02555]|uniref:HD domain-containing protein n=1 Tax=Clostridium sp. YIM B02555 TaxID=2911968 RepID=UPI001EEE77ED|nr:ATP-binding protein [Clostridium sp. YIM B02555]